MTTFAESFTGMPSISVCRSIECPQAAKEIQAGDEVEVDFDSGIITDVTTGKKFQGQAFPPFMQKIITAKVLSIISTRNNKKMSERTSLICGEVLLGKKDI